MSEDNCKDHASLIEQMFTENVGECTRDVEFHVFRSHLLTLRRK